MAEEQSDPKEVERCGKRAEREPLHGRVTTALDEQCRVGRDECVPDETKLPESCQMQPVCVYQYCDEFERDDAK
jgi:hypothetical protein